jgi:uncharacterized membrane protein
VVRQIEPKMSVYMMIKQYLKSKNDSDYMDFVVVGNQGLNFASKDSK